MGFKEYDVHNYKVGTFVKLLVFKTVNMKVWIIFITLLNEENNPFLWYTWYGWYDWFI